MKYITNLFPSDFEQAVNLIEAVRDHLPDGIKHHLKPKTLSDLFNHHRNNDLILGAVTPNGDLVALMIAQAGGTAPIRPAFLAQEDTALIQSVCIHPDHTGATGGKIIQKLFAAVEEWGQSQSGLKHLSAKIAISNDKSMNAFLRQGFAIAHNGADLEAGYDAVIVQKAIPALAESHVFTFNVAHENGPTLNLALA